MPKRGRSPTPTPPETIPNPPKPIPRPPQTIRIKVKAVNIKPDPDAPTKNPWHGAGEVSLVTDGEDEFDSDESESHREQLRDLPLTRGKSIKELQERYLARQAAQRQRLQRPGSDLKGKTTAGGKLKNPISSRKKSHHKEGMQPRKSIFEMPDSESDENPDMFNNSRHSTGFGAQSPVGPPPLLVNTGSPTGPSSSPKKPLSSPYDDIDVNALIDEITKDGVEDLTSKPDEQLSTPAKLFFADKYNENRKSIVTSIDKLRTVLPRTQQFHYQLRDLMRYTLDSACQKLKLQVPPLTFDQLDSLLPPHDRLVQSLEPGANFAESTMRLDQIKARVIIDSSLKVTEPLSHLATLGFNLQTGLSSLPPSIAETSDEENRKAFSKSPAYLVQDRFESMQGVLNQVKAIKRTLITDSTRFLKDAEVSMTSLENLISTINREVPHWLQASDDRQKREIKEMVEESLKEDSFTHSYKADFDRTWDRIRGLWSFELQRELYRPFRELCLSMRKIKEEFEASLSTI